MKCPTGLKSGNHWFAEFNDKNNDYRIQYNADELTNELIVDADIMVLANPKLHNSPTGLSLYWRWCSSR